MTQLTTDESFQIALRHHRAGHLPQAEEFYRQVLNQAPNHADALHNLGLLTHQMGQSTVALDLIRRATSVKPEGPEAWNSLGEVLRVTGQLNDAIAAFLQATSLRPGYAAAHYNLGNALRDNRQLDEAIASYRQAIALNPDYFKAHGNLGAVLQVKGQIDEAIASFRRVVALMPDAPEGYCNLGAALAEKGQLDAAINAFRGAVAVDPNNPFAYNNLGVALKTAGKLGESIAACRQAIERKPDMHEGHANLGNALAEAGQLDEAIASNRAAIALKSDYAEAFNNLGVALSGKGQADEAIAAYRQAVALRPDVPEVHRNLALSLLRQGDFQQGWHEYEWRWKCKDFPSLPRKFSQPLWDGRNLDGGTLLLQAEQGIGDTLQFVRYLPVVVHRGGKIILECQPELHRLLQVTFDDCHVVAQGQPIPAFDVHCPLLSLPRVFESTPESIPRQIPYLRANVDAARKWRNRMAADANTFRVGLAWADSSMHRYNRDRSMELSTLVPLSRLQGVSFYSLQKGNAAEQLKNPPEGMKLIDWTRDWEDFADEAAFIANLDFVIAVDTAVVHLAGAMGKRVGVMLPFAPDWRWMLQRKDSPWYPTMRLFRQPSIGDWNRVVRQVTEVLRALRDKRVTGT